ncbi:hypothetical protein NDU88_003427 [Pleurodeles waltl]|uniref:Uncharacterized protein n=1 Tax=Pleurodeles waltl TaxID=8319 RepID=A0AAV7L1T9_PLEWA|nr:hypothetical protein NDU88_003427 [Pleurodeles waltl]
MPLLAFFKEVETFGAAVGFRINVQKSQPLNISVSPQIEAQPPGSLPVQWAMNTIPYLGIQLAATGADTALVNYRALVQQVKQDLV